MNSIYFQRFIGMSPKLNEGDYVYATLNDFSKIDRKDLLCDFKVEEGTSIVIEVKLTHKKRNHIKGSFYII